MMQRERAGLGDCRKVVPVYPEPKAGIDEISVGDLLEWAVWSQQRLFDVQPSDKAKNEDWESARPVLTLPPLQRNSVWRPPQVLAFWDSLLSELPIGLLSLIIENGEREIVNPGPKRAGDNHARTYSGPGFALLDGQQRLRALTLCRDDPFGEQRCLWVSFTENAYELRLTSRAQPFGYDKNGAKLLTKERSDAREAFEKKNPGMRWNCPRKDKEIYDRDLYDIEDQNGNKIRPLPWKCEPNDTIRLSHIFNDPSSGQTQVESLDEKFLPQLQNVRSALQSALQAHLPLQKLEGRKKDLLIKLFTRIGAGGTVLTESEQRYSAYKLYKPAFRGPIEDVRSEVNATLPSARIVETALKIAQMEAQLGPYIPDVKSFCDALGGKLPERDMAKRQNAMKGLDDLLSAEIEGDGGSRLHVAFGTAKALLGHDANDPTYWLPDVLIADLSPGIWDVVVYWAVKRPEHHFAAATWTRSKQEAVRFALFWHLCMESTDPAIRDSFELLSHWNGGHFPGRELYSVLTSKGRASAMLHPEQAKHFLAKGVGQPEWLTHKDRFADEVFAAKWWYGAKGMLPWLQREYVKREFGGYVPLSDHEDDLPYDRDHVCARSHWRYDGREAKPRFTDDAKSYEAAMRNARDVVGEAIGNYRLISSRHNRGDGDASITDKMPFLQGEDEKKARDFGFSLDGEEVNYWLATSKQKDDPWTTERLKAFQSAAALRTDRLYREFFTSLHFEQWVPDPSSGFHD